MDWDQENQDCCTNYRTIMHRERDRQCELILKGNRRVGHDEMRRARSPGEIRGDIVSELSGHRSIFRLRCIMNEAFVTIAKLPTFARTVETTSERLGKPTNCN